MRNIKQAELSRLFYGENMKTGRPRVEGKKKANFSIDENLLTQLKRKAEKEGRTLSGAIEQAIARWLQEDNHAK